MTLTGLVLSMAVMVPPGQLTEDHTQPYHWGQPVIRRFERRDDDMDRGRAWQAYVRELNDLWADYRDAGSTPSAFRRYQAAAGQAKRRYIYRDIYYAPILP